MRAPTYDAALELVNTNPYGNGTAIFTNDGGAARRFVNEVHAGMVGVNVPIPVPMAYYSFGGWKNSLLATATHTGPRACTSSPVAKLSRPDGSTRRTAASTLVPDPELSMTDLGTAAHASRQTCELDRAHMFRSWSAQASDGHHHVEPRARTCVTAR